MQIPIRILVTDVSLADTGITWGDVIDNWEAYNKNWELAGDVATSTGELPILDMFNDEPLTIKHSVKDLSDPAMTFTSFSKTFDVPASKKNNVIFRHYYNLDITDGIDSRTLIPAKLLINNEVYQVGNISVDSIVMDNGKPQSYSIRFYGKLTDLVKKMGQETLRDLSLSGDIIPFTPHTSFGQSTQDNLVFPLTARNKRLAWHSTDHDYFAGSETTRNIAYSSATAHENYALRAEDLVPAYSVGTILDAIESKYNLTFSGALTQNYVRKLYMWLTATPEEEQGGLLSAYATSLSPTTTGYANSMINGGWYTILYGNKFRFRAKANFGTGRVTVETIQGNVSTTTSDAFTAWKEVNTPSNIKFFIESNTASTYNLTVEVQYWNGFVWESSEIFTDSVAVSSSYDFILDKYLPNVTIVEFLTELFRLFNIVAEVSDSDVVETSLYDAYMAQGSTKDISKYVDVSNYSISRPNLYRAINFTFDNAGTALEEGFISASGLPFGNLKYEDQNAEGNRLVGDIYDVRLEQSRIPEENFTDIVDGSLTGVTHTAFQDRDLNETLPDLAFTYVSTVPAGNNVAFYDQTTVYSKGNYLVPTSYRRSNGQAWINTYDLIDSMLSFRDCANFTTPSIPTTNLNLYNLHYRNLIRLAADENKRKARFRSFLPQGIVKQLHLGDLLVISNDYYVIESYETNYLSGETILQLIEVDTFDFKPYVRNVTITNNSATIQSYTMIGANSEVLTFTVGTGAPSSTKTVVSDVIYASDDNYTINYV